MRFEEAQAILRTSITTAAGTENIPLDAAAGRIAAEDITARYSQPPFDRSPLDGYALYAADFATASKQTPVVLPVSMKLCAGDTPTGPLAKGNAARIMTGAPVPAGADCVVRQEDTDYGEERVTLYAPGKAGGNICFAGEDIAKGELIAARGARLTPAHLGVMGGQGMSEVTVYKQLRIGVLATGSELLAAGAPWQPGKIYDANGAEIASRLRGLGFAVIRADEADDPDAIAAAIKGLLTRCDAVITTGGVSVGQKDYLPQAVETLGAEVLFHGVAMKPGSPMLAAMLDGKPVFCLSGNPFAAAATLELLALPALLQLAGAADTEPERARLRLENAFNKKSPGRRFLRAKAHGGSVTLPESGHSSGSLSAMIGCNCFVDIPAGSGPLTAGQEVEVVYFV